jgi:hypothetical protein
MKKSLVNKLVIPLVVSTGLSLVGCFPPLSHKGKAFRDSVGRQVVGDIIRTDIEKSQGHRDYQTNRNDYQRGSNSMGGRIINVPDYEVGDIYFSCPGGTKWVRIKENCWMVMDKDGTINTKKDIMGRNSATDYEVTKFSINSGMPIIRDQ